jgi:hypothetical protein
MIGENKNYNNKHKLLEEFYKFKLPATLFLKKDFVALPHEKARGKSRATRNAFL